MRQNHAGGKYAEGKSLLDLFALLGSFSFPLFRPTIRPGLQTIAVLLVLSPLDDSDEWFVQVHRGFSVLSGFPLLPLLFRTGRLDLDLLLIYLPDLPPETVDRRPER